MHSQSAASETTAGTHRGKAEETGPPTLNTHISILYNVIALLRREYINTPGVIYSGVDSRVVPPRPNYETNHKLMARPEHALLRRTD